MENNNATENWFVCYSYEGRLYRIVVDILPNESPLINYHKFENAVEDWLKKYSRIVPKKYVDNSTSIVNFIRVGIDVNVD